MPLSADSFYKIVSDDWEQGDLIHSIVYGADSADLAVLLTPQCDIVFEKADYLLLVLSSDFKSSFQRIVDPNRKLEADARDGIMDLTKNQLSEVLNHILRHLRGAASYRFYYLPGFSGADISVEHTYIDFQRIITISKEILGGWKEKRVANIKDPFRSQLLSRYVSYMGRVGAPDYQEEDILGLLNASGLSFRQEDFVDLYKKQTKNG